MIERRRGGPPKTAASKRHGDKNASTGVRAVDRGMAILRVFTRERPRLSVSEIGRMVGLNKSTVHRFLRTLERGGFIVQDPVTKLYSLGLVLGDLGQLAMENVAVSRIARPFVRALQRRCNETVHFAVLEVGEVVYVDKAESTAHSLRLNSSIGKRAPAHCTGLGKALLAYQDEAVVAEIVERRGLARFTNETINSPEGLKAELAATRARGYAIDNGEYNALVRCIAAPVFDRLGEPVAAVSVTVISVDYDSAGMAPLAEMVRDTARAISVALGSDSAPAAETPS